MKVSYQSINFVFENSRNFTYQVHQLIYEDFIHDFDCGMQQIIPSFSINCINWWIHQLHRQQVGLRCKGLQCRWIQFVLVIHLTILGNFTQGDELWKSPARVFFFRCVAMEIDGRFHWNMCWRTSRDRRCYLSILLKQRCCCKGIIAFGGYIK